MRFRRRSPTASAVACAVEASADERHRFPSPHRIAIIRLCRAKQKLLLISTGIALLLFLWFWWSSSSSTNGYKGSVISTPLSTYMEAMDSTATTNSTNHAYYFCQLLSNDLSKSEYRSSAHIPHVVAWVAGCWAWLQEQQQVEQHHISMGTNNDTSASVHHYALGLDSTIQKRFITHANFPRWNQAFFAALQLPLVTIEQDAISQQTNFQHDVYERNFGDLSWFGSVGPCDALRRRIWSYYDIQATRQSQPFAFCIGLVDRASRRRIKNARELHADLTNAFPDANVSLHVWTDADSLRDQVEWYSQQDIVVQAHGASMTNVMFMRPNTAVLELFPRHFCFNMFRSLAEQCRVKHFLHYDGNQSQAALDFQEHFAQRGWLRNQNIEISLFNLQERIQEMRQLVVSQASRHHVAGDRLVYDPLNCSG